MREPPFDRRRTPRTGSEPSRERLLRAGLQLFAAQGFSKTSIRAIAESAQANVAAIRYYFGDKAGLYRAAFFEPFGSPTDDMARYADPAMPLTDALREMYGTFLEPLAQGETVRLSMQLRFREMLETTGLLDDEITQSIQPQFTAIVQMLSRHVGVDEPDDDVRRLAISVVALGVNLFVTDTLYEAIAPSVHSHPRAMELWSDRLVMFGEAMVHAEIRRRAGSAAPLVVKAKKK